MVNSKVTAIIIVGLMIGFGFTSLPFFYDKLNTDDIPSCEKSDEYVLIGYKWKKFPIRYNFTGDLPTYIKTSSERAILIYDDLLDFDLFKYDDNNPMLTIMYKSFPSDYYSKILGEAEIYFDADGISDEIQYGEVRFNSKAKMVKQNFSCQEYSISQIKNIGADIDSVTLHEIGHALGLWHNNDRFSTMYYGLIGSFQQTLTDGDIKGILKMYG